MRKFLLLPLAMILFTITHGQVVSTYAGQNGGGLNGSSADGTPKANFSFTSPFGIAIDNKGNMYIGDNGANYVYMIDKSNEDVYTRVGSGPTPGFSNGRGVGGILSGGTDGIMGMVPDANGNIYFIDYENNAIRKISAFAGLGLPQLDTIIAGMGGNAPNSDPYYVDSIGIDAVFFLPTGLALDPTGKYLYVADWGNNAIRQINLTDGKYTVTTVVGTKNPGSSGVGGYVDGPVKSAELYNPEALTVTSNGDIYVADGDEGAGAKIRVIAGGMVSTLKNSIGSFISSNPSSIIINSKGIIYVADGCRIVKDSAGLYSTFAGDNTDSICSLVNATGTAARFNNIGQMIFNTAQDTIYAVDSSNYVVRTISIGAGTTKIPSGIKNPSTLRNISMYPNPANNNITITGEEGEAILSIYTITGKEMVQEQVSLDANGYELPLDNFSNGCYVIKIQTAGHISAGKFVVDK